MSGYPPEALLFETEGLGLVEAVGLLGWAIEARPVPDDWGFVHFFRPSELTPLTPAAEEFLQAFKEGLE